MIDLENPSPSRFGRVLEKGYRGTVRYEKAYRLEEKDKIRMEHQAKLCPILTNEPFL